MPFVEYMLLALLGSAPAAGGTPVGASGRSFTADSIAQPAGGATGEIDFGDGIAAAIQCGGGVSGGAGKSGPGKKPLHHTSTRHHRRHHRSAPRPPIPPASSKNAKNRS